MADNILTKDRADANLDIAAKDIGGVQHPRNIIVDPSGNDITPLTDAQLRATAIPVYDANLDLATHQEDTPHVSGDYGQLMLAIRSDNDTPTANDGDYTVFKLDEEGRLKVATKPASYADITGDITAVQATISTPVAGGTVAGDVSRASNIMAFCTGTFAGVNCTFEGSINRLGIPTGSASRPSDRTPTPSKRRRAR